MQRNQVGQGVPVPARRRSLPALPVRVHRPRARAERRGIPAGTGPVRRGAPGRARGVPAAPTARHGGSASAPATPGASATDRPGAPGASAGRSRRPREPRPAPAPRRGDSGGRGGCAAVACPAPGSPRAQPGGGICPLLSPDVYVDRGAFVPHGCPGSSGRAGGSLARCTGHKGPGDVGMLDPPPHSGQPGPARLGRGTPRLHRTPQQTGSAVRSWATGTPGAQRPPPAGHPRAGLPPRRGRPGGFPADPGVPSPPRPGSGQPGPAGPGLPGGERGGAAEPLLFLEGKSAQGSGRGRPRCPEWAGGGWRRAEAGRAGRGGGRAPGALQEAAQFQETEGGLCARYKRPPRAAPAAPPPTAAARRPRRRRDRPRHPRPGTELPAAGRDGASGRGETGTRASRGEEQAGTGNAGAPRGRR